jgi:Rrf2 family protein
LFSQTSEYALRIVIYLASLDGAPATTRQIAKATEVPVGYLSKVLQSLSRAGIVHSRRGLHGGSTLARPAEELSVYDVASVVAPFRRIRTCPLGLKAHGTILCPLHRRLDDAMALVEQAFRDSSIAELLAEPSGNPPRCEGLVAKAAAAAITTVEKSRRRSVEKRLVLLSAAKK